MLLRKPFGKTLEDYMLDKVEIHSYKIDESFSHHKSHAAAGFYTSPFHNANILVVDAIGEWDTTSIWYGDQGSLKTYRTLKKIYSRKYPWSLGLLYSAVTQLLGFKPNEEEYIVMGIILRRTKHKTMLKRKLIVRTTGD